MWVVIKLDKKNFDFFKKELKAELGCDSVLYYPNINTFVNCKKKISLFYNI